MRRFFMFTFLGVVLSISLGFLFGCSTDVLELAKQKISERVDVFYSGVGDFKATISSGVVEENFAYDGKSANKREFSVATIYIDSNLSKILASVSINGQAESIIFDADVFSGVYMAELNKKITTSDQISITYKDKSVNLACRNSEILIDSNNALQIALNACKNDLEKYVSNGKLACECFLRIIERPENDFKRLYWYFYIYGENGTSLSCIITVDNGEIINKN